MIRNNIYNISIVLLLMMVLGVGELWGQNTPSGTDYSGYYYIANFTTTKDKEKGYNASTPAANYYLCPAQPAPDADENYNYDAIYYDGNSKQQPYLTTYRTGRVEAAMWKVEFATTISNVDYYYIRCCADNNKYLTHNTSKAAKDNRFTVHLQATAGTNNESLFCFETTDDESFNIRPQKVSKGNRHINPANGNQNYYYGINGASTTINGNEVNPGGMIGYWSDTGTAGYGSRWYLERVKPTISYNSNDHTIEISNIDEDVTIYYTDDGTTEPTTGQTENMGTNPIVITDVNNSVSIKAIAAKSNVLPSLVSEIRVVPNATITFGSSSITYNGSEQKPAVTVKDGNTTIPSSEYEVGYSNNVNASDAAVVTVTNATGGNYIVYGSTTFVINKKDLAVTAKPKTITYGDEPVNDGVEYSGFITGESATSEGVLGGNLTYAYNTAADGTGTAYTATSDQGAYYIIPSGLSATNYAITFVAGTLTVGQKEVGLTWSETTSFPYDGASHGLTATATGMVNGDEIGVTVTGAQISGGNHTATASALTGTKAGNYKLPTENTHAFTIIPAQLTVTANNHTITYGDAPAGNGVTYSGFIGTEDESVLGGTLDYDFSYTQYGDVGNTYTITPKGVASNNYNITFTSGSLAVTPKTVGIDWTDIEFTYNGSEQVPNATATGMVNSDDIGITVTGAQTNAGNYTATASALTGNKKDNYKLPNGITQAFTISPKTIGDGDTAAEGITVEMTEDGSLSAVKDGSTTLVENTDYTQKAEEDGSDKIITITGIGNYTGIVKGIYASPQFDDPDGDGGPGQAAAVYMAKRDLSCPSGIKPYIIRKVNPSIGTAVITPLDYIPVDVPVLLLSDAEASGFVASPKDPSTSEVTAQTKNSNLLKVSAGGETVEAAQIYLFYKGEFVLTKAGTLKEGKFYLYNPNYTDTPTNENSGSSNARGLLQFVIDDEEPTGITEFETLTTKKPETDIWYTLDGRRLSVKPSKAGIYIHQGQKEYIKR